MLKGNEKEEGQQEGGEDEESPALVLWYDSVTYDTGELKWQDGAFGLVLLESSLLRVGFVDCVRPPIVVEMRKESGTLAALPLPA